MPGKDHASDLRLCTSADGSGPLSPDFQTDGAGLITVARSTKPGSTIALRLNGGSQSEMPLHWGRIDLV